MEKLKILFVGIGSIAKRHIRNLQIVLKGKEIPYTFDAFRQSDKGRLPDGLDRIYFDINEVPDDYDAVFITNPTEKHLETLEMFHDKGNHFFIEKPVVAISQIEKAEQFKLRSNSVYYVACPLRYHAVVQYIKKNIKPEEVISVRSISSSYLPEWRPGQDYRKTYSAHKDMGGGVSIDLVHEWDYLTHLFGWPEKVKKYIGKKSQLEIDSDDYAIYIAEYANMIAELHLDYFGRKTIREIELFVNKDTIIGDLENNKIRFLILGEEINFHEERDDYQRRELEHFLDMILGICEPENGYCHGIDVLELTQGRVKKK